MNVATWIPEREAAQILGYKSIERFRRNVKSRKIAIGFRSTNGRLYQYNSRDLKKFQDATSFGCKVS